jgi:pimeloyl-ACP methyl ester carboxylesterase
LPCFGLAGIRPRWFTGSTGAQLHDTRFYLSAGSWSVAHDKTRLFFHKFVSIIDAMRTETVRLNDVDLCYASEGTGTPLVLLHGGTGCHKDWAYAGYDQFVREYLVIRPDARGHGATGNSQATITHRQCALDTFALLDHLGVSKCRAIGVSMGGNILLHMATMQPNRIEEMVVVSATMYFPEQARQIMRQVPPPEKQPSGEWERMRSSHKGGDEQIINLWNWIRDLQHSYDDMNFTPPSLSRVTARTLVVHGDRDPLYAVEMAVAMHRAIEQSALWVVPNGGHGPIFGDAATQFADTALRFFRTAS